MLKVIYIAGPYRNKSEYEVAMNIYWAGECALDVWKLGGVALCPHKNTAFFGGARDIPDEVWIQGDLELLSRCDAILLMPNWKHSTGAKNERKYAKEHNITILSSRGELREFLTEKMECKQ